MKAFFLGLLPLALLLAACEQQSEQNADTEKRIATCQDVMRLYIEQGNVYERDRKRLIGSCHISQKERSLEQWQCTLAAMQKGEKFEPASNKCGRTGTGAP